MRNPKLRAEAIRLYVNSKLLLLLLLFIVTTTAAAAQSAPHHAGLVVRWAGQRVGTYVVSFDGASISGGDLLQSAFGDALEMDWQAGGLVAAIGGVGCHPPAQQAFCQCQGTGACTYWRYFHLKGGQWVYSSQGATAYQIHDGDVEGWSWASSDAPPPVYTFAQLTAPPATPSRNGGGIVASPSPPTAVRATLVATPTPSPQPSPTREDRVVAATPAPSLQPPPTREDSVVAATPTPSLQPPLKMGEGVLPSPMPSATVMIAPLNAPTVIPRNSKLKTQNFSPLLLLALTPFIVVVLLAWGQRGRRGFALDSRTWLAWLLGAALLVSGNPYYLLMLLLVCLSVYLACTPANGSGISGGLLLRFGLAITGFIALFNFLTAHYGETVLARLPQEWPAIGGILTLEGLVAGLLRGLALLTLLAVFAVFNRAVDHYELLKLTPRSLYRVGLAASVAVAFVPQTLVAAHDIAAAQELRGYRVRVRDLLPLFAPLLTLGLEKAVQMAEALETRAWGYTAAGLKRTRYQHVTLHRADFIVITTALITAALALVVRLLGWLPDYYPYPSLSAPDFNPAALIMLLLLVPAALALLRPRERPIVKMRNVYDKV